MATHIKIGDQAGVGGVELESGEEEVEATFRLGPRILVPLCCLPAVIGFAVLIWWLFLR